MIYINGRFLTQSITGVGRFALEISKALQSQGAEFTLLVPKKYQGKVINTYGLNLLFIGSGDSHIWEQFSLWFFIIRQPKALLLSFTGLGPVFYKNKIMTIHDLSFFHEPKWFSRPYYYFYKFLTPIAATFSKYILTVSEFSKSEIVKYLGIDPSAIKVVYNGNSFADPVKKKIKKDKEFVLGVSSLDARKNHKLLIKAFAEVSKEIDVNLVLVGKAEDHFNFDLEMLDIDSSRIRFTGYIPDTELKELYEQALLFVYPSLYEGFGIPPLEAIYYKCPILISDIPVLHEIFSDSAVYFDPLNVKDLQEKMIFCIQNVDSIKLSEDKRIAMLAKFSWEKSALKIIELL